MRWLFWCPTADEWLITMIARADELKDTRPQMGALLAGIRHDVDNQFDEYQGKWRPLRPYTITKKETENSDMRILHESRTGLRLRDAYKQAGYVTDDGILEYTYPVEKPYAREHQEGAVIDPVATDKKRPYYEGARARKDRLKRDLELDREYYKKLYDKYS